MINSINSPSSEPGVHNPGRLRLILLTHQFPYATGDAAFISREIEALSDAFDEIIVATHGATSTKQMVALPANCTFVGSIHPTRIHNMLRAVIRSPFKAVFALSKSRNRTQDISFAHTARALLTGLSIANHPKIRKYISRSADSVHTVVYSFWGRDIGYLLPWIDRAINATAVRVHGYDLYNERNGPVPLQAEVLRSVDLIFPISNDGRDYLLHRYPDIPPERVVVQYLGVEGPADAKDRPHTQTLNLVSCSSVIGIKRIERILEVAELYAIQETAVKWVHFGDGPLLDSLRVAAKEAMERTPQLSVEFRGHTSNDEIISFYRHAPVSVFINLSTTEGLPVSAMEAIAWNIPVVATDVGGVSELVGEQHGTGLIVDVDASPERIVATMAQLIAGAPENVQPHAFWSENFDSLRNSRGFAEILRSL